MLNWLKKHKKQKCDITVINETIIVIEEEHYHRHSHHLVLTTFINNSKFEIMSLSIVANEKVIGSLGLIDSVTNEPVSATFQNTTATSGNTASYNASVNADGSIEVTGVAEGSGDLVVTSLADFTDSLGHPQSVEKSVTIPVSISAVQTANGTNLVVNFGTPTPQ